ncbi:hypothetical protein HKCCE2091_10690 [Rhodobacterales bacterium HKCCE2091]|nr:hypothetical protein [Rhodobacterales bacterium HKCCE2091]
MSHIRVFAVCGISAIVLSACAQPPAPTVTRATPLYSKAGDPLCVPSGDAYNPNYDYGRRPNCDDVCESDPVAGANVAICPPVYDRGRSGVPNDSPTGRRP